MSAAAYAAGTVLGSAHSGRAAEFRALAPGFLGMDGRRGGVRILLCSGFPNSAEWNAGRPPRAVTARVEKILSRLLRCEKLTAFLELELAIRACGDCKPAPQTVLNNQ